MGASTAAALWTAPLMTLLVPDADQLDLRSGPMAITTALVAICAGMPVLGQKWVVTAAIALAAGIACAVVTTLKFRVPEAGAIAVWYLGATFAGVLSAYIIEQSRRRAFAARRRSETLLHNVLPEVVATRLKRDPSPIADRFEDVTVLFGDIVGFTPMSASMSPEELVASLDRVFTAFDALAERHGLEKIKTIGDAYMVVGGVPTPRVDHAEAIARMAIGMRQVIAEMDFPGGVRLEMRIGIHSGSVVAGVIGRKKFSYDLWGDTVNTASRMESHGEPGEIHVSDATQARLASRFVLRDRGLMHVKGKGELRTWFLDGAR
jgi:class 3 adenylate cyclase